MFVAIPGDPTVPQRALAAEDEKTGRRSFLIASVVFLIFGAGLVFIGCGAMTVMPNIADEYGTTEAAFPIYIMHYYPPVLTGLGIAALLAAIMSTISAMLLVATTHLIYDVGKSIKPDLSDEKLNKVLPWCIVVLGGVVVYTALQVTSLASTMYFIFSLCGSAFIFPMIATLWWKNASKWGVTLGIVLGAACCLGMYITGHMGIGGDPVYTSMIVSGVSVLLFSLIIRDKDMNSIDEVRA
jgi:Na+/proline symporter